MRILAVDPGGVTGWAGYDSGEYEPWFNSGEVPGGFDGWADDFLLDGLDFHYDTIVVENFVINQATHKKDPVMIRDTNDIIGMMRWLAFRRGQNFVMQTPAKAKGIGNDDNLRALGWYRPSKGGHQNDAARHLVAYLAGIRNPHVIQALARADA